jgi:hypothetical protein
MVRRVILVPTLVSSYLRLHHTNNRLYVIGFITGHEEVNYEVIGVLEYDSTFLELNVVPVIPVPPEGPTNVDAPTSTARGAGGELVPHTLDAIVCSVCYLPALPACLWLMV